MRDVYKRQLHGRVARALAQAVDGALHLARTVLHAGHGKRRGHAEAVSYTHLRETDVLLRGGTLHVAWADDGHVMMTGPAAESFAGTVNV